jgi:hypothetical protein
VSGRGLPSSKNNTLGYRNSSAVQYKIVTEVSGVSDCGALQAIICVFLIDKSVLITHRSHPLDWLNSFVTVVDDIILITGMAANEVGENIASAGNPRKMIITLRKNTNIVEILLAWAP